MVQLELSRDEARMLEMFLLMTTKYREDQVIAYRMLLEGRNRRDISDMARLTYADNVQHWLKQCETMDGIRKRVSEILLKPVNE